MAEIEAELRDAIRAYFRAGWGDNVPLSDTAFTQFVDKIIIENRGGLQEMFLALREQLGRYPTFEELHPPGSPFMG